MDHCAGSGQGGTRLFSSTATSEVMDDDPAGEARSVRQRQQTRGCGSNQAVQARQAFSQVGRRRRPEPVLTYERATGCINDMGRMGISRQTFEQTRTQLTPPTCIVISLSVFTNSFAVGLAMMSSTLTNLLAVGRLVPSLPFKGLCFVRLLIGSVWFLNSLPILWLPLLLFLNSKLWCMKHKHKPVSHCK